MEIHDSVGFHGSDRVFMDLSEELRKKGIEVYQFALTNKDIITPSNQFFLKINTLNIIENFFSFKICINLIKYLKLTNPNIIHFHTINSSILGFGIPIFLAKIQGVKIIKTQHDWGMICSTAWHIKDDKICKGTIKWQCAECYQDNNKFLREFFGKRFLRNPLFKLLVDVYTAPSKALTDDMKTAGFTNTVNIYNFYSQEIIEPTPRLGNRVIFLGRIVPEKGIEQLVKSVEIIKNQIEDIELQIVGIASEEEKKNLSILLDQYNIEAFTHLHFNVSDAEKMEILKKSKVCIVPSIWKENNPLVILEAMASSVPIVAFSIGGIPEMLNDVRVLAKWGDVNDMAKKTIDLLKNEELRLKVIQQNIIQLKKFDKESIIQQWLDLFNSCMITVNFKDKYTS
jgi:glycosyltransferase involved in cell wall biosynthesis